jgi:hypothetical protein
MHSSIIPFQCTKYENTYQNQRRDATAERGVCFHPTIGSVTPNGFTTGHPRARPRCSEIESFLLAQQLGTEVTLLLPAQRQLGTEVTLLLPQDLGNGFSLYQAKRYPEYFLSHSAPSFISLYHNPTSHILRPEHAHSSVLPRTQEFLSLVSALFAGLPLPTMPSFLSFLSKIVCGPNSPVCGQV